MKEILARLAHWKTTTAGVAVGGAILYLFNSLDCKAPADWSLWLVTVLPVLVGMLAKDK